ncbi:MAG: tail fiber domain-containing protein [Ignavibacteria bacterium]|nr:tail fiber domain-containing protein [Ignavibacteria bacterium]
MKIKLFLSVIAMLISCNVFGQNIIGKLGLNGDFVIKDTTSTFLTVSQSTGHLTLYRNLRFATMTAGSQTGAIYKGNLRFLHNYFGSGTTGDNTFLGVNSGNFTLGGTTNQGSFNTGVGSSTLPYLTTGSNNSAFGYQSLFSVTSGSNNSAFGNQALYSLTTGTNHTAFGIKALYSQTAGYYNCAFGFEALYSNTSNFNSAFGYHALYANTTGYRNTAFGMEALYSNTTGFSNFAFGFQALRFNLTGHYNTAFGESALYDCNGNANSAFGMRALQTVTTGNYNTAIGLDAGSILTTGSNNIMVGNFAQVPSSTGNNQVRIGYTGITYAGIQVAWTITSDINWKDNITSSGLGLGFISKLKPVSYIRKNDEKQRTEYGFIAQDIEKVLNECGVENAGMITIDDEGRYELRYNDLLAPMVKAIQELKEENDELKDKLQKLEQMQIILMNEMSRIKTVNN